MSPRLFGLNVVAEGEFNAMFDEWFRSLNRDAVLAPETMPANNIKPMELRARIERALTPMVEDLRLVLAKYPTVLVLNYYLGKAHAIRMHSIEMPDGYWPKFRYLWAVLLSLPWKPYDGVDPDDLDFAEIDQRIEDIFHVYRVGAIYDPGKVPGSRREFLARMGWAIRVWEPDVLAFPEQIGYGALVKLAPFDDSFFRPQLGNSAGEMFGWVSSLIERVGDRSEPAITEGYKVRAELELLRDRFVENPSNLPLIRADGEQLRLEERLIKNSEEIAHLYVFSRDELREGLAEEWDGLIELLEIHPAGVSKDFMFPHDENPLEFKSLVALPDGSYYFSILPTHIGSLGRPWNARFLPQTRSGDATSRNATNSQRRL